MSTTTVLLTGATGSLGASTLVQLMNEPNVNVITVLRSSKRSEAYLRSQYASQVSSGRLSFLEIPDMSTPNIFDDAASRSDAIIHIATPLAYSDFMDQMIKPSWTILHNVLSAAEKSARVKRVIVTGSVVSTLRVPDDMLSGKTISADTWNGIPLEAAEQDPMSAYQYAKTYSERKAWEFMKEKKRTFDLIVLLAPSITGKSIQEGFVPDKTNLGGQPSIYRELFDRERPGFMFPFFMDVEDVAKIHVLSLSGSVPGNERYLFHSREMMEASDLARGIREDFPQLRSRVPAPDAGGAGGGLPPALVKTDIAKFERVFGTQWKSGRQSTKETVEDIVAFEKK